MGGLFKSKSVAAAAEPAETHAVKEKIANAQAEARSNAEQSARRFRARRQGSLLRSATLLGASDQTLGSVTTR
jgi:hypothetical protein